MSIRFPRSAVARGATVGVAAGAVIACGLLLLGREGGEAMEGAFFWAHFLSWPTSYLFEMLEWGGWASQWVAFILIAPTLNGMLIGTLAGLGLSLPQSSRRRPLRPPV